MKRMAFSLFLAGAALVAASGTGRSQIVLDVKPEAVPTLNNLTGVTVASRFTATANVSVNQIGAYLSAFIGQNVTIGIAADTGTGTAVLGNPTRAPVNAFLASGVVAVANAPTALYTTAIPTLNLVSGTNYWFIVQGPAGAGTSYSATTSPGLVTSNGATPVTNPLFSVPGQTLALNTLIINGTLGASAPANWNLQSANSSVSYQLANVPEPSTFVLGGVLVGVGGLVGWKRHRARKASQVQAAA